MSKDILFLDLVLVFASAFVGGLAAERLRQSPVIGYIIAGILIGPHVLGLISNTEMVENFAEIGIVLLMFTLGIEFSFNRLAEVKRVALLGGLMQILLTILFTLAVSMLAGLGWGQSFALGCVLSLSSTMVVLKVLEERGDLRSVHGQLMVGFLIVQDLAAIFMFALLPQLKAVGASDSWLQAKSLVFSLALTALVIYLLQVSVPRIMDKAARGTNRDVYLVFALAMALGVAFGIKENTGCSVLSITKGNNLLVNPKGDVELEEGDILAIIGTEEQWKRFLKWLKEEENLYA